MEKISFSIKGKRQMSAFLARELLYDYTTEQLDPERTEAVKLAMIQNPTLTKELDDILYGLTYCSQIAQTKTKAALIEKMKQPFSMWRSFEKFFNIRGWNPAIQWMGEAVLITITLLFISYFVPWESMVFNFIAENKEKTILLSTVNKKIEVGSPGSIDQDKGRNIAQADTSKIYKSPILRKYILQVANPQFTYNKLPALLPKFGANITDQVLVPVGQDTIPQITLSIPQDRAEALIKHLETHGKLTLSESTGDNEKEKEIWTFQIELRK